MCSCAMFLQPHSTGLAKHGNNFCLADFVSEMSFKGTIPPCSKLFLYRNCMSKDSARSTGHVGYFFPKKYCATCKKSTIKVLINFGFVTLFELTVITFCFSDTFIAHNLYSGFDIQNTFMSTVVLFQWSKWSIATSLSPKCYSSNVPLDFCTTADFEIKYFFQRRHCWRFG